MQPVLDETTVMKRLNVHEERDVFLWEKNICECNETAPIEPFLAFLDEKVFSSHAIEYLGKPGNGLAPVLEYRCRKEKVPRWSVAIRWCSQALGSSTKRRWMLPRFCGLICDKYGLKVPSSIKTRFRPQQYYLSVIVPLGTETAYVKYISNHAQKGGVILANGE